MDWTVRRVTLLAESFQAFVRFSSMNYIIIHMSSFFRWMTLNERFPPTKWMRVVCDLASSFRLSQTLQNTIASLLLERLGGFACRFLGVTLSRALRRGEDLQLRANAISVRLGMTIPLSPSLPYFNLTEGTNNAVKFLGGDGEWQVLSLTLRNC